MKNKYFKPVAALSVLALASAAVLFFPYLEKKSGRVVYDPVQEQKPQQIEFNQYGLPNDTELSQKVTYQNDSLICYEDRVMFHFPDKREDVYRTAQAMKNLLRRYPNLDNAYVLPIPPRMMLETGWEQDHIRYLEYRKQLIAQLSAGVEFIDVLPMMEKHREEYVYFRTEDSWTGRGALYGMEVLCQAMDLESIPFEDYREYRYGKFHGFSWYLGKDYLEDPDAIPSDGTFYYVHPESKNSAEYFEENGEGFKGPAIRPSASNLGTFPGSLHKTVIVEGRSRGEKSDSTVLLLCDASGAVLANYLADYFGKVYVVNTQRNVNFHNELPDILKEYHIEQVILAQNALQMGNPGYSGALQKFVKN